MVTFGIGYRRLMSEVRDLFPELANVMLAAAGVAIGESVRLDNPQPHAAVVWLAAFASDCRCVAAHASYQSLPSGRRRRTRRRQALRIWCASKRTTYSKPIFARPRL
jgi:hypothetical protein